MASETVYVHILRSLIAIFVTLLAVDFGLAEEWASPDGVIVVKAPDPMNFDPMDDPPAPFMALWLSKDETVRLGVMKMAIPPNVKLIRSSAEEGLTEEVGGRITASSSVVKNGHEIWILAAEGTAQGMNLRITQALVQYGPSAYKVMAVVVGMGSADNASIDDFVNSIQITAPTTNDRGQDGGIDLHNFSKKIG